MLQGITEEVKKKDEQRINSRFIMSVSGIQKLALKNTERVDIMETLQNHKILEDKRLLGLLGKTQMWNDRGALL